MFFIDSS